jgi:hypothetical protein
VCGREGSLRVKASGVYIAILAFIRAVVSTKDIGSVGFLSSGLVNQELVEHLHQLLVVLPPFPLNPAWVVEFD